MNCASGDDVHAGALDIVFLTHYYPPEVNGGATRVFELAKHWVADGHRVTVYTGFPCHPYGVVPPAYAGRFRACEEVEYGVRLVRGWRYASPNDGLWGRGAYHLSSALTVGWLNTLHRTRSRPDVVISSSPPLFFGPVGKYAARVRQAPMVLELRDLWPDQALDLGLLRRGPIASGLRRLERWSFRWARGLVTVTEGARAKLLERGVAHEKVRVIPNGVDVDYWRPVAGIHDPEAERILRRIPACANRVVIGYVGTFGYSQGLETLVEVVKRFGSSADVHFLFVGAGARWKYVHDALLGEPQATVWGAVSRDTVRELYGIIDIALTPLRDVPTFHHTIPSKLYEVAATETPQVVSVPGEAARLVEAAGIGTVARPEDPGAITAAINQLISDRDVRVSMGLRARRWARSNVSRALLARRYVELLREWSTPRTRNERAARAE